MHNFRNELKIIQFYLEQLNRLLESNSRKSLSNLTRVVGD